MGSFRHRAVRSLSLVERLQSQAPLAQGMIQRHATAVLLISAPTRGRALMDGEGVQEGYDACLAALHTISGISSCKTLSLSSAGDDEWNEGGANGF